MHALTVSRIGEACPFRDDTADVCRASVTGMSIRNLQRWRTNCCGGYFCDCAMFLAKVLRSSNPFARE